MLLKLCTVTVASLTRLEKTDFRKIDIYPQRFKFLLIFQLVILICTLKAINGKCIWHFTINHSGTRAYMLNSEGSTTPALFVWTTTLFKTQCFMRGVSMIDATSITCKAEGQRKKIRLGNELMSMHRGECQSATTESSPYFYSP